MMFQLRYHACCHKSTKIHNQFQSRVRLERYNCVIHSEKETFTVQISAALELSFCIEKIHVRKLNNLVVV